MTGARLSENGTLAILNRMGRKGQMTTQRSSFRTWALERTNFPWELAELSLGHKVGTKVEQAYLRGSGFQKRKAIMQAWTDFCGKPITPSKVVSIHERSAAQ